jgi:YebC/PmpR family DNA-binding regulatory protein
LQIFNFVKVFMKFIASTKPLRFTKVTIKICLKPLIIIICNRLHQRFDNRGIKRCQRYSIDVSGIKIQRAIDRVSDKNAAQLEEIAYEAMGPGGIGIVIEVATDNRNRTFPDVRTALTKNGGRIADAGSVMFQFTRKGVINVAATGEDALLTVLDAGAEDAAEEDDEIVVYTDQKDLAKVRTAIIEAGLEVTGAELQYIGNTPVEITDQETADKVLKVLDALDDLDDVTSVHTNADIQTEE